MAQEWDIKPRGTACSECATEFEDRQAYFSALLHGDSGYARSDFCRECWERRESDLSAYSAWQGIFMLPPPKEEEALKKETAESLLRKLMEEIEEDKIGIIYILAVMLERKRILEEKDVQVGDDGSVLRVYEHKKTGETFLIPDPQLELDKLEVVQQQVIDTLGGPKKKSPGATDTEASDSEPDEHDDDEGEECSTS